MLCCKFVKRFAVDIDKRYDVWNDENIRLDDKLWRCKYAELYGLCGSVSVNKLCFRMCMVYYQ
jgi:hypothetical protein